MNDVSQNDTPPPAERSGCLIAWLVITQIIGLLSLIPWMFAVGFAFLDNFVFTPLSGGGHMDHPVLGSSFQSEWLLYPVVLIGFIIAAWIFFALKQYKIALVITSLQLLCAVTSVFFY